MEGRRQARSRHRRCRADYHGRVHVAGRTQTWHAAGALAALAAITVVFGRWFGPNVATVATLYLMVVLLVAATSSLATAVATSVVAALGLNFFFLPPVGTFAIAEPQNWITLFAFLTVSVVASRLSAQARARAEEAVGRRDELARLFDLSRDVLLITDSRDALTTLARAIGRRFDLAFAAIALPRNAAWEVFDAGTSVTLPRRELDHAFASAQASLDFDARSRTYAGHRAVEVAGRSVRLVPLRVGTKAIGLLAAAGRAVEPGTLDTLAGLAAIAIERAQLLERSPSGGDGPAKRPTEVGAAGLDQSRSAHAADGDPGRGEQRRCPGTGTSGARRAAEVILAEVERLTRLFENLLEMARIDAGSLARTARWTHPSEIVSAARARSITSWPAATSSCVSSPTSRSTSTRA